MSYRDETIAVKERLLALDVEHAALEGRADGLRFRNAAAEDDAKRLIRDLRIERAKGQAQRLTYRLVGGAVALGLALVLGLVGGLLLHACSNVSETVTADYSFRGETQLEGCQVVIHDAFAGPCSARAWCASGLLWEGQGTCREDAQGAQFWSDEGDSGERFSYVRGALSRAVYRDGDGVSTVLHLPGGRGL